MALLPHFPHLPVPFHPTRVMAVALALLLAVGQADAASFTVLVADETAAASEFVRRLRDAQQPAARVELVRGGAAEPAPAASSAEEERAANAGVRMRSVRGAASESVTVAVGSSAARAALERPGSEPVLLTMLSRLDYEHLKALPASRRTDRRVGVLLRDPSMSDQLALIEAVLPQKRRLGVVATSESEPVLQELQRAAGGWALQVEYAPNAGALGAALRAVLPRSDALLVMPDLIGDNQAATLAVLRAGATAGLPVFGTSEGLVRSGGLAAAVSTPEQLARQARAMGQKLASGGPAVPLVESAAPATVRVNTTVARGLGLRLPDERVLTEKVTAIR